MDIVLLLLACVVILAKECTAACNAGVNDIVIDMCAVYGGVKTLSNNKLILHAQTNAMTKTCKCSVTPQASTTDITLVIDATTSVCKSTMELKLLSGTSIATSACTDVTTAAFRSTDFTAEVTAALATDEYCVSMDYTGPIQIVCAEPLNVAPYIVTIVTDTAAGSGTQFTDITVMLRTTGDAEMCRFQQSSLTVADGASTPIGMGFCDDVTLNNIFVIYFVTNTWNCYEIKLMRLDTGEITTITCNQQIPDPAIPLTVRAGSFTRPVVKDYCIGNLCTNGAMCVNGASGYTCDCVTGYSGTICDTNIDECASTPCQNGGVCVDQVNGYVCNSCPTGTTAPNCVDNVNNCVAPLIPCLNGAGCVDGLNTNTCSCTGGYTGTSCETELACPFPTDGSTYASVDISLGANVVYSDVNQVFFMAHNITDPFCSCQMWSANHVYIDVTGVVGCISHFADQNVTPINRCLGTQLHTMDMHNAGIKVYFGNYQNDTVKECLAVTIATGNILYAMCTCDNC